VAKNKSHVKLLVGLCVVSSASFEGRWGGALYTTCRGVYAVEWDELVGLACVVGGWHEDMDMAWGLGGIDCLRLLTVPFVRGHGEM